MNRLRKFRRSFGHTVRCEEMPRIDVAARMSISDQLRSIRKRAAAVERPSSADSHARMARIDRIRIAIAEGRYHVSAADLAQKLIDHIVANRPQKL